MVDRVALAVQASQNQQNIQKLHLHFVYMYFKMCVYCLLLVERTSFFEKLCTLRKGRLSLPELIKAFANTRSLIGGFLVQNSVLC